jgi:uncharacterized protein (TIGR03437 family)
MTVTPCRFAIAAACILSFSAMAQTISGVRIDPGHPQAHYTIDGQLYTGPAVMLWPEGSKHTLSIPYTDPKIQLGFKKWFTNLAPDIAARMPITASRELTSVTADVDVYYSLMIAYFHRDPADPNAASPGRVCIVKPTNVCFDEDTEVYVMANATVEADAYPNQNYIFTGWGQLPGALVNTKPFQIIFNMNQPQILRPLFATARPTNITIQTSPPGLQVLADRAAMSSGTTLEWGIETIHTLGVIPVQVDSQGLLWIFDSWSDGGAMNHDVKVPGGSPAPLTFTARFVRGATYTFLTSPPLLRLSVDGRENWQNYTFQWAAGTRHTVAAPLEQIDDHGHKYKFVRWLDGATANRDVVVPLAPADVRYTAEYQIVGQITVNSDPAGIHVAADGQDCITPCVLERNVGDSVKIAAPVFPEINASTQFAFQGWSDGGGNEHTLVFTPEVRSVMAAYHLQYRLAISVEPAGAAVLRVDPSSSDGFYDAGTTVGIALDADRGYRFSHWEGDLSGINASAVLSLASPRAIRALFDAIPFLFAVRNAAVETEGTSVAPGSLISIMGRNLAAVTESAGSTILPQSLGGTTVSFGSKRERFLPLLMVSPDEVRAQLPSDVDLGDQTLVLSRAGKPDSMVPFQVRRNAPGLFYTNLNAQPIGMFVHENGEQVTSDNPALRAELLTVLGTGIGPYQQSPPDGFAVSNPADFSLVDLVGLISGDSAWPAADAGAAKGLIGVNTVRFRLPATLVVTDALVPIQIQVNDIQSNTVYLPVDQTR